MAAIDDLIGAFELHSPEDIRRALDAGADPRMPVGGKTPIWILIEMYNRSSRFAECVRIMLDAGATLNDPANSSDPALEAVLLDDERALQRALDASPEIIHRTLSMECAFTSLQDVGLLHVAAEYGAIGCARVLLKNGADVNVAAATGGDGFGGQTPIFHTVNSNHNYCRETMELLVDAGADLAVRLKGLVWGRGFEWETTIFDVTPISYAQCGLYSQFHRPEKFVYGNIVYLYQKRYGHAPALRNVPNQYLADDRVWPPRT